MGVPVSTFAIPQWLTGNGARYFGVPSIADPTYQTEFRKSDGTLHWKSNAGPQTFALFAPFNELVVGGRRGGGKSLWLMAKPAMGDLSLPADDPARASYLNDPDFRALFLREEYQSLVEFIEKAGEFYRPFGGKMGGDPKHIDFPSGARIYFNHLQDETAFNKYKGWNLTFIGIEELTQIRTLKQYLKLLGSLRSVERIRTVAGPDGPIQKNFPPLRTQIASTTNPDGPGACIPYGDVLTESGWKDIRDMRVGDRVWSIDPTNGQMVLRMVEQVHSSLFEGEMYEVSSRGIHIACTPNHKILRFSTTKKQKRSLVLQEIDRFPGQATVLRSSLDWKGSGPSSVEARSMSRKKRAKLGQPTTISIDQYAALVGWMVTEGSLVKRDNALCISQVKKPTRDKLRALLDDCGFSQNWSKGGVLIYSHEWLDHFLWMPHAHEKYIPQWVKNLPKKSLQCLFNAMIDGDGTWAGAHSGAFYTSSSRLASDFCEIALKCGYIILADGRQRAGGGTIHGRKIQAKAYSHEIQFHRQSLPGSEVRTGNHTYAVGTKTARVNTTRQPFLGPVYCIGVEGTHSFIVRQKGCVWVSGNSWVMDRFVYVPDERGKDIPWGTPMYDTITDSWRCFIPFPIEGNPYLAESSAAGKRYRAMLMSQDETTRKQWMDGDWKAGSSLFFGEYRPNGPNGEEEADKFPWANHRVKSVRLRPWWYRFGSGDWGYGHPAAFHKFCRNEDDKRLHVYDELQVRQVGAFELGALLAKWWHPDLLGLQSASQDACIVIHIGSDMFRKTSEERTIAEQMASGVREVLGPYGAVLMKMDDSEREIAMREPKRAQAMLNARIKASEGHLRLALKPCWVDRVAAWSYFRDMLRFRPALLQFTNDAEKEKYLRQVLEQEGQAVYEVQAEALRKAKPEVLPKLQIWDICKELDRCLRVAQRDNRNEGDPAKKSNIEDVLKFNADSEGLGGDDALESARNGIFAYKEIETTIPQSYYVQERMEQIQKQYEQAYGERLTDPTRLWMIAQTQVNNYNKQHSGKAATFSLPSNRNFRRNIQ